MCIDWKVTQREGTLILRYSCIIIIILILIFILAFYILIYRSPPLSHLNCYCIVYSYVFTSFSSSLSFLSLSCLHPPFLIYSNIILSLPSLLTLNILLWNFITISIFYLIHLKIIYIVLKLYILSSFLVTLSQNFFFFFL